VLSFEEVQDPSHHRGTRADSGASLLECPRLMVIHDLTASQCRELLGRTHLGRLACAKADQPYITPIFFYYDAGQDSLFSFSTLGQKVEWMRGNPKVCVEVDEIIGQQNWRTVLVFGRYEEIDDSAAGRVLRTMIQSKLEGQPGWWLPGAAKLAGGPEHHVAVLYRVRVDRLSGRHAARPVGT